MTSEAYVVHWTLEREKAMHNKLINIPTPRGKADQKRGPVESSKTTVK